MAFVPDVYQEQTDANAQRNQVKEIRARPFQYKVTKPDGSVIMENYLLDESTNAVCITSRLLKSEHLFKILPVLVLLKYDESYRI